MFSGSQSQPARNSVTLSCGTPCVLSMKHLLLVASLFVSASILVGCDTEEDCGNPFGCKNEATQRMTSSELGDLIGVDESTIALVLDEKGYTPELDEESDEFFYKVTNEGLDVLAMAVD